APVFGNTAATIGLLATRTSSTARLTPKIASIPTAAARPLHPNGFTVKVRGIFSRDHNVSRACLGRLRTTAITRSSNDLFTRGEEARNSFAIRLMFSSSSCTVHLAQQLTEAITRAHDAHLERRHP